MMEKKIQQENSKSEGRFRFFFENAPVPGIFLTREGKIIDANKSFEKIMGSDRNQFVGKALLNFIHGDWKEKFKIDYLKIVRSRQAMDITVALDKIDGTCFHVCAWAKSWRNEPNGFDLVCFWFHPLEDTHMRGQVHSTMDVLMEKMNQVWEEVQKAVESSINRLVFPYVDKLKNSGLNQEQKILVGILESNLHEIVTPFVANLATIDESFTPMEIQIAHLVREGKTNKEIAHILTIASRTVGFHRENIRKKLGIKNKKVNLRSVLLSFC